MKYICDVTTREELAELLKIPLRKLTYQLYINKPNECYTSFEIKKKSGGIRTINSPSKELMNIQRRIADALLKYECALRKEKNISADISHAFEKNKSIFTNARVHRNKKIVVNLDLKDFFPSIHFGRVMGFFMKNKNYALPYDIAVMLTQLCCYNGRLPQGAPTSPIIANLICGILDMRLLKITREYRMDYTRYADDLTFSTNNMSFLDKQDEFINKVTSEIIRFGFAVNEKKTRVQPNRKRQEVTGLTVNKKINVDRNYYKETRAMANNLYINGKFFIDGKEGTITQLEGRFSFINQADRYNNLLENKNSFNIILQNGNEEKYRRFKKDPHNFRNLNGREEQYRKFIFYKYFYANDRPVIVTEGKTDIVYLRAALKNLYKDYPELIEKTDDKFSFKISFLKRTKRFEYFFGFAMDGAAPMKNLYNYFSGAENQPNYYRSIAGKTSIYPSWPVIFMFDNEISLKDSPLKSFSNHAKMKEKEKEKLMSGGYVKLKTVERTGADSDEKKYKEMCENSNLYVMTHQLVDGKKSCEIEDLFSRETLAHEIKGRTFSRKDEDKNKYYNKDIFSDYINSNYRNVDFSGFRHIFDNITEIINNYHSKK